MLETQMNIEFVHKLLLAYGMRCKPLCQEMKIPQTAFDILMFLANNPKYNTARDIVEIRRIKANLVSVNVEKLVQEGYLSRQPVPGDRRKNLLVCTDKAKPIIEKGHQFQAAFFEELFKGIDDKAFSEFSKTIGNISSNIDCIMERGE